MEAVDQLVLDAMLERRCDSSPLEIAVLLHLRLVDAQDALRRLTTRKLLRRVIFSTGRWPNRYRARLTRA